MWLSAGSPQRSDQAEDSNIKIEVWSPLSGWNNKLMGTGNFGWAGSIMYGGLLLGLERGDATVSTDTGHDNSLDAEQTERSMRRFAVPGMGHCFGGAGCDAFDKLTELDRLVESGKAPDRIIASKV